MSSKPVLHVSKLSLQIENIMASLDAGLPDCDVVANGVTSSSHNRGVTMTTTPYRQPTTGARGCCHIYTYGHRDRKSGQCKRVKQVVWLERTHVSHKLLDILIVRDVHVLESTNESTRWQHSSVFEKDRQLAT